MASEKIAMRVDDLMEPSLHRIVVAEQRANDARERAEQLIQLTKVDAQKSIDESEERAWKLVRC
ncbi:hypothetical protein N7499_012838 [Penicillium canescens]|nr:hypothetical protein N7499_012838 [Penicillium canescens]KAJ6154347.1 hypothetical protein N7485_012716 [Penicillium canescens]